jgi:hypothetical protein
MRIAHAYPLPPPSWSAFSPLTWQAALPPTCVSEARAPISALPSPTRCLGLLMGDAARCDPEMGAGGQRDLEIGEMYARPFHLSSSLAHTSQSPALPRYIPHDIAEIVARIWKARGAGRVGGDVVRVCGFLSFVCLHPAFSACDSYLLYASTSLCLHALPPPCLDLATPSLSLVSQRLISLCNITNPLALSRTKITDRSPSSARAAADAVNACDRDVFTAGLAALSRDGRYHSGVDARREGTQRLLAYQHLSPPRRQPPIPAFLAHPHPHTLRYHESAPTAS